MFFHQCCIFGKCFLLVDFAIFFFFLNMKVELGSRAGALKQMLLDLLEDHHAIRRICVMGRNCTIRKGDMECAIPSERHVAEGN